MIVWHKDKETAVYFDDVPRIKTRIIADTMSKEEVESIKSLPLMLTRSLKVALFDVTHRKKYTFTIPKKYCYDGLTIPRFIWSLLGVSKLDNRGQVGSLIHDYLCEHHALCHYDREFSTRVLKLLLIQGGIPATKAKLMCWFVNQFQKTQHWEED